jgi:predicted DNA-binding transcriptional regulator AlpA
MTSGDNPGKVINGPHEPASSGPRSAAEPPRWIHDSLIGIAEIRTIFHLGRTAAYELTHRPGFPDPVPISPRCYRWWASEVAAFTAALHRQRARSTPRAPKSRQPAPAVPPRRITGTIRATRPHKQAS